MNFKPVCFILPAVLSALAPIAVVADPRPDYAGRLLQPEGAADIYLIDGAGYRRHIMNPAVFEGCGLRGQRIDRLAPTAVRNIPATSPLIDPDDCKSVRRELLAKPQPALAGELIQALGRPHIYLVGADGRKRHILSMLVYNECGLTYQKPRVVSQEQLEAIALGAPLFTGNDCFRAVAAAKQAPAKAAVAARAVPEMAGRVIRSSAGPHVYLVGSTGEKHHIANPNVFNGCGLTGGDIQVLSPAQVDAILTGPSLNDAAACQRMRAALGAGPKPEPAMAGRLVKPADGPTVYLIGEKGLKHPFPNPTVFNGCGLSGEDIEVLPPARVKAIQDGPALGSAQACLAARKAIAAAYALPRAGVVRVTNTCGQPQSIAIKNEDTGQYQVLDSGRPDARLEASAMAEYPISGRRFYAHFSGFPHLTAVSTQFAAETERDLVLRREGSHCVIRVRSPHGRQFAQGPAVKVAVTNLCNERKSIAIKNEATGEYQKLDGERADAEVPASARREFEIRGERFYAHFSGLPHLTAVSTQFAGHSELLLVQEGANCAVRAGTLKSAPHPAGTAQTVLVRNNCTRPESIAIRSISSGQYQAIDGNRFDLRLDPSASRSLLVFGEDFWGHWSGRTDLGVRMKGSGLLSIEPGGTPCKLAFYPGFGPIQGTYRIRNWRTKDPGEAARIVGRMIEIYTVPGATPTGGELDQIAQFEHYVNRKRVEAASLALEQFDEWSARGKSEVADWAKGMRQTNQMGILLGSFPRPPEHIRNFALTGMPLDDTTAASMQKFFVGFGAAIGGIAAATAAGAAVGSVATSLVTTIYPFAQRVLEGVATPSLAALGAGTGATVVGTVVATAIIAGTGIAEIIKIDTMRSDLLTICHSYRTSRFSVAAAARSEQGRNLIAGFMALQAAQPQPLVLKKEC